MQPIRIWLYAAIRPRYGPGPRTAIIAGFAMWLITSARDVSWVSWGFGPASGLFIPTIVSLPIMAVTSILVAWAYKEGDDAPGR